MSDVQIAGIDLPRLRDWVTRVAPGAEIDRIDLITGGKSNLTYRSLVSSSR